MNQAAAAAFFFLRFLPENCTKETQKPHIQIIVLRPETGENKSKGGGSMNRLIARLIDCGMTREVALCMMRQYKGRPHEFELYVESVEESSREQMEEI